MHEEREKERENVRTGKGTNEKVRCVVKEKRRPLNRVNICGQ